MMTHSDLQRQENARIQIIAALMLASEAACAVEDFPFTSMEGGQPQPENSGYI